MQKSIPSRPTTVQIKAACGLAVKRFAFGGLNLTYG
jgi:hypothetical protein